MFYKDGKKRVSLKLENYLTPLVLAVWIMASGKFVAGGVQLYTYFYSIQDIEKLINMLTNRYGLKCSFHVSKEGLYRVDISNKSIELLRTIVGPYLSLDKNSPVFLFSVSKRI
jgi:hypothetical protein